MAISKSLFNSKFQGTINSMNSFLRHLWHKFSFFLRGIILSLLNKIAIFRSQLKKKKQTFIRRFLIDYYPSKFINKVWNHLYGYEIDWNNPRNINEKIQWLSCFSDTSLWSLCSDKYRVRDFIRSKGLDDILIKLLGVWDKAEDIDYDKLPNKFILKCNHDSGSSIIINKSIGFDKYKVNKELNDHLKIKYGYVHGERHYNRIKPCIIAEEFLESPDLGFTTSLVDYKIWCFDGKPYSVWACYSRTKEHTYVNIYDLDWVCHPEFSIFTDHYRDGKGKVPKPKTFDRMLEVASILSKGFPEVRVDFYEVNEKLYFGELTFASICGRMNVYTQEYLEELGRQCVLPK